MKINQVIPQEDYIICVIFDNKASKIYDVKPLFKKWEVFNDLKKNNLFTFAQVDVNGQGIIWNDEIDLSKYEIWENGQDIHNYPV